MQHLPIRKHPARGVYIFRGEPTIVFLTVCSYKRQPQLANNEVHAAFLKSWQEAAAWMVGFYLIMPDHTFLFAGKRRLSDRAMDHILETSSTSASERERASVSGPWFSSPASSRRELFG